MQQEFRERYQETLEGPYTAIRMRTSATGTCPNPAGTPVTTTFSTYSGVARTWSKRYRDYVTPNFSLLSRQGKIINNPMWSEEIEILNPAAAFSNILNWRKWEVACNPDKWLYSSDVLNGEVPSDFLLRAIPYSDVPGVSIETEIDQALTRAWANTDDNNFTSLASLGELKETISGIKDMGLRLFRLMKFLRKLDDGKAWRMYLRGAKAGDLADRYMELRYSIRPLIFEIKQLAAALDKPRFEVGGRQTFRGYSTDSNRVEDTWTALNVVGQDEFSTTYHRVSTREVKVRAGVLVQVKSSHWLDRWGFDDILETAWELTRLSFVVDWFLNIGQKIAAFTPEFGLVPLASWYVVEDVQCKMKEIIATSRKFTSPPLINELVVYQVQGCKCEDNRIVRYRVPNPRLDILPTFKIKLDLFKVADMLVILNQFRGR